MNGSTWRTLTASGEFGWNNDADGALFTSALTRTLIESRFEQLDANRDGVVSWSELQGPVTDLSRSLFDSYKEGYLSGRFPIDSVNLDRLRGQGTQTPQFFSYGSPAGRELSMHVPPPPANIFWNWSDVPPPSTEGNFALVWRQSQEASPRSEVPKPELRDNSFAGVAPAPANLPPRSPYGDLPYVTPPPGELVVAPAGAPTPPPGFAFAGHQAPTGARGATASGRDIHG